MRRFSVLVSVAVVAAVLGAGATPIAGREGSPIVGAPIPVGAFPIAVAAGVGGVWVAAHDDSTVVRIDPARRTVAATIPVPSPINLAVGEGAVWVLGAHPDNVGGRPADPEPERRGTTTDDSQRCVTGPDGAGCSARDLITKIDPATNQVVAAFPAGVGAESLAVAAGAVWIPDTGRPGGEPALLRLDPATGGKVARIPLGPAGSAGEFAPAVAAGADALWVLVPPCAEESAVEEDVEQGSDGEGTDEEGSGDGRRADEEPDGERRAAEAPDDPDAATGRRSRRGCPEDAPRENVLLRVDPETNRVAATVRLGGDSEDIYWTPRVEPGAVWLVKISLDAWPPPAAVVRVDPAANRVATEVALPGTPSGLAVDGHLWVTDCLAATVTRLDPRTGAIAGEPILVGTPAPPDPDPYNVTWTCPADAVAAGGELWVAMTGDNEVVPIDLDGQPGGAATPDSRTSLGPDGAAAQPKMHWQRSGSQ